MSQIRLRILGESVIQVGETIVEPSATHVFALLLYLAIERGKLVTRSQLASMLFPEASAANAGHNLRQLLYRLRRQNCSPRLMQRSSLFSVAECKRAAIWKHSGSLGNLMRFAYGVLRLNTQNSSHRKLAPWLCLLNKQCGMPM